LDNTLYDWLSPFVPAFYAMVEAASKILSVDKEILLDELKIVHQHYHNSEQPFAILETPSVKRKFPHATRLERKQHLDEAFLAFNKIRKQHLSLYPGVRETLHTIREQGTIVVGHTEAVVENSLYRLKLLDLISEINRLYAPMGRAAGHPDTRRPRIYEPYTGFVYLLPSEHRKPDPEVLKDICKQVGISTQNTLYVGDSMTRDISMAKMAGTYAALAGYGTSHNPKMWEQLVRVSHWTDEDIKREKRLREEFTEIHPDVEIDSFSDLLRFFEFENSTQNTSLINHHL
jgi:phosphoglycolate phosphatase